MLKHIILFIIIVVTVFNFVNSDDQKNSPYSLMNKIAQTLFTRLNNEKSKVQNNPNHLRNIVEQELLPHIYVRYAGALALGSYYKQLLPSQRDAYFLAFREYLKQIYSQALTMYHGQKYLISSSKTLDSNTKVVPIRVTIINSNNLSPIRLDFLWCKNTAINQWQIYDMIIEGVSTIVTKKNEWNNILRTKNIEYLTKQLYITSSKKIIINENQ